MAGELMILKQSHILSSLNDEKDVETYPLTILV